MINKDKIKEQNKEYRIENKDKINEQQKEYYIENKEKIIEQQKEYHIENKDIISEKTKVKVICEHCNTSSTKSNIKKHQKTDKCIKAQNSNIVVN